MRLNSEKQQQPSQVAWFCVFFGDAFWNADCMEILLTFVGEKKQNMHHVPPRKINMNPKEKRVWKMMFLLKGVIFRFRFRFLESF